MKHSKLRLMRSPNVAELDLRPKKKKPVTKNNDMTFVCDIKLNFVGCWILSVQYTASCPKADVTGQR